MIALRLFALAVGATCLVASAAQAKDLVVADGPGGTATYPLLQKSYGLELPDCGHMVPHITETMDAELGRGVFVFHAHVNQDDDRCGKTDRQRTELRGNVGAVQGPPGTTVWYRWMFRLPVGFKASGAFTHIFQIKGYGNGFGSGAPRMTLTPRNDTMSIDGTVGRHGTTALGKFLGHWVVVNLKVLHANAGRIEMTIRKLKGGEVLFSHAGNHDTVEDGAAYGAPKFGIYRSLNDRGSLRDEDDVRFADFCVSKTSAAECEDGSLPPPPPAPDGGTDPEPAPDGGNPDSDIGPEDEPDAAADAKAPPVTTPPATTDAAAQPPATPPRMNPPTAPPAEDPPAMTAPARGKGGGCRVGPIGSSGPWGVLLVGLLLVARRRLR